ncbi:purL [Acrasis kona]|uniref:PurL n=1 Tax=Acrasis kona TaxID=1008807 RepID=A0AAW2YT48_9EUKA
MSEDTERLFDVDAKDIVRTVTFSNNQIYAELLATTFFLLIMTLFTGVMILGFFFLPLVYIYLLNTFKRRRCFITKHQVVYKQEIPSCFCALYNSTENHVQLQNVVDVVTYQSFIQKWFKTATITLKTSGGGAGELGQDMYLTGVEDVANVKRTLLDLSASLKRGEDVSGYVANQSVYYTGNQQYPYQDNASVFINISESLMRIEHMMKHNYAKQQQTMI